MAPSAPPPPPRQQSRPASGGNGGARLLEFAVAIDDAKAVMDRLRRMRRGAPLHLPTEAGGLHVWEVLRGSVRQRRVWALCRSGAGAAARAAEPLSLRDGVAFVSAAAGRAHGAAADAAGHVYTWGANDRRQCGVDDGQQAPAVTHALLLAAPAAEESGSGGDGDGGACSGSGRGSGGDDGGGGGSSRRLTKLDSLSALASSVRLPPSLLATLRAQQEREARRATREAEVGIGTGGGGTGKLVAAAAGGSPSGAAQQQQQAAAAGAQGPELLHVYRLSIGQAVTMVACGGAHTLAALRSGGLLAWGDNSKGQCGLPVAAGAAAAAVVPSPARVHAFHGARVLHVAAGARHSAVVQEGGALVSFGCGRYGRLGLGFEADVPQPPSVVEGALRGKPVIAAAAGSAHTLALTADGRVYAFGYNGRGALGLPGGSGGGAGGAAACLVPVQVPGLLPCCAVAAGAASMALGVGGEVYVWGECAPPGLAPSGGPACDRRLAPVAALAGASARSIACGVDVAAAVTDDGALALLGSRDAMPPSLCARARLESECARLEAAEQAGEAAAAAAAAAAAEAAAAASQPGAAAPRTKLTVHVGDPSSVAPLQLPRAAAAGAWNGDGGDERSGGGSIEHLLAQLDEQHSLLQARGGDTAAAAAAAAPPFDPEAEALEAVACGEMQTLVLCGASDYRPTVAEVREALLAVLSAYIRACGREGASALSAEALAGRDGRDGGGGGGSGGGWEGGSVAVGSRWAGGSVAGWSQGVPAAAATASVYGGASVVGGGRYRAASTVVSLGCAPSAHAQSAASPTSPAAATIKAAQPPSPPAAAAPVAPAPPAGVGRAKAVSFGGDVRDAAGASAAAENAAASASPPAVQAAATTGTSRAPLPPPLLPRPPPPPPPPQEIGLHGVLLLCREAGLVDDLTDHADVRAAFGAAAHRKAGRLGPAGRRQKEQQAQQQQQRVSVAAAAAVSSPERSRSVSPSGLPETLLFVPVSSKRPQRRSHSATTSRSLSPPPAGNAAVPAAAAAAAAPPATLDARELLELLLLLVRDRHASLRRDPEALLRLLAARYVSRLRARRPDKGPPWLLRQALRPEVLAALEAAPGAPEALHAAYVHLSARGAPAASDLTLSLADARLGLKRAAAAAEDAAAGLEAGGGDRASPTGTGSSSGSTAEQRRCQRQTEHQRQRQRQPQGLRLDRLAAFLRAAGLVPRVLAIYLGQLQRGSGGGGSSGSGSSGGGPAAAPMPSLRLAAGGAAAGFDEQQLAGAEQQQRRRQQQQQQQQLAAVASWTAGRATSLGALVEEGNGTESVPASPGAEPHGALRSPFARGESKRLKRAVSFCGPADDAAAGVASPTGSMLRRRPSMLNRRLSRDECVLY